MVGQAKRLYQLNNLFKIDADTEMGSKIISITSGKGGTGKSFVASNIALDLANEGSKVLLIDLDINFANQNVLFNISSKKTLYHYLTYNHDLEDIIYKYSENLSLILGESGKVDHPKLGEERAILLMNEIKSLSSDFDVILIDTSSGLSDGSLQILLKSDEIVIVSTPEPTSVMDAYVVLKMLKSNDLNATKNVIFNKCVDDIIGNEAYENLEKAIKHFLKTEVKHIGNVSFSNEIMQSIQDQSPLILSNNSSIISSQIRSISDKLRIPTIG